MGWTGIYTGSMTRKERKHYMDRVYSWDKVELLKSAMVGTTYYAAVRTKETGEVWAGVALTRMEDGEFIYKDMSEDVGPCEQNCPAGILNLLTETKNEYALAWRKACRENLQKKAEISKLKRTSLTGYVVKTVRGYVTKLTSAHIFFGGLMQYKVWPTREQAEAVVARFSEANRASLIPVVCEITRDTPTSHWN